MRVLLEAAKFIRSKPETQLQGVRRRAMRIAAQLSAASARSVDPVRRPELHRSLALDRDPKLNDELRDNERLLLDLSGQHKVQRYDKRQTVRMRVSISAGDSTVGPGR